MLNSEQFTNRLQEILNYYQLSAAAFAEKIGIGRSSISHIISGRNKPSLDMILHILENFDEVQFEWLVYGRGNFPAEEKMMDTTPPVYENDNKEQLGGLFSNTGVNENKEEKKSNTPGNLNALQRGNTASQNERIERIVIFYKNGSFTAYANE